MKFKELSTYLEKLEQTSSRIEITKILADLFKKTDASEIDKVVYLILGDLAPGYKGIVFNLAERMMIRVIAKAYAAEEEKVKSEYKRLGDLGETASFFADKKDLINRNQDVAEVYHRLMDVAEDSGEDSQERKIEKTANLLNDLDPLSAKFVARIPVGRLRLGFSDKTILDAISWMEAGDKSKKSKLESAFNILPDVGLLAKESKEKGIDDATKNVTPHLGIPLMPVLMQRLKSPKEMIEKMKRVFIEPKFDGLRIQIHFKRSGFKPTQLDLIKNPKFRAFTRNLNETSWMFPELEQLDKFIKADEAVFDSEAVGVDEERKAMANFQATMSRRRKHDIAEMASKVSMKFNVFDIMFKDGKGLTELPYEERRKILEKTISKNTILEVVDYEITNNPEIIEKWLEKELKSGYEGIAIKRADSKYKAGRTGYRWVKMKEAETQKAKLADTVDAVVMGYTAGRGKRVSFGVGQFLAGVRVGEYYKTITKVGTGLTDEQFKGLNDRLKNLVVKEKPKEYEVNKLQEPDYYVNPEVVVELAADEITKSPTHTSGYAMRFPRLVKFRDDKSAEQSTTLKEVEKLFKLQRK